MITQINPPLEGLAAERFLALTQQVPVLIIHGDDDQLVPLPNTGAVTAKLLRNATFKVYPGEPHGLITTSKQQVNEDILAFIKK